MKNQRLKAALLGACVIFSWLFLLMAGVLVGVLGLTAVATWSPLLGGIMVAALCFGFVVSILYIDS